MGRHVLKCRSCATTNKRAIMPPIPNHGFLIMDTLANMAMFVRVVDTGSFAAAAEASGVSPTMAGKHIRAIEQRLGARLLHRTTRRQQLTEVGRLYYASWCSPMWNWPSAARTNCRRRRAADCASPRR
jgi:hypothetical protein